MSNTKKTILAVLVSILGTAWIMFMAGYAHAHAALVLRNAGAWAAAVVQHENFVPVMVAIAVAWGVFALCMQLKELKK